MSNLKIRTMSLADIEMALGWAAEEGWNPGRRDASCFQAADPEGFLVGELDGEPIAIISAVRYHDTFGFIGFYIVRSDMRGQGYGMEIWSAAMQLLGDRNVGLDAVPDQVANYERSGFRATTRTVRFEGTGRGKGRPNRITDIPTVPFHRVLELDARAFPAPRASFLRAWFAQSGTEALAIEGDDSLEGYAVLRRCRSGWKIGPLFATGPDDADLLLDASLDAAPKGESVLLDVPEYNATATSMAQERNMKPVFETVRMYSGPDPQIEQALVYGVTTLELG